MATSAEGACCVCGISTAQRCGACSEAGFDLFFCSREHQKFVYFAHKQVCGERAKPFRFPPLSPEEIGGALSLIRKSFEPGGVALPLLSCLLPPQLASRVDMDFLLAGLERLAAKTASPATSASEVASTTCEIRHGLQLAAAGVVGKIEEEHGEPILNLRLDILLPLPSVAAFATTFSDEVSKTREGSTRFPVEEDWYTQILHQALVVAALRLVVLRGISDNMRLPPAERAIVARYSDLYAYAAEGMRKLIVEVAERDDGLATALEVASRELTCNTTLRITKGGLEHHPEG